MKKLSIVVPAHNEEKRISPTIENYLSYFKKLKESRILDFEIIVVLNACKDNTKSVVNKFKSPELIVLEFEKGGKGFAVIEGFKESLKRNADLIGFVDADMSTLPDAFHDLVKKIGPYGGTIASRYKKGANVEPKNTLPRIMASRVYNVLIRSILLIPYRDTQCGAKLFTNRAVKSIINKIGMTQWAFDIELLYKIRKSGFVIREIPTVWSNRAYQTINFWQSGPFMALGVIRLRLLNSPLRFLVGIYDRLVGGLYRKVRGKKK